MDRLDFASLTVIKNEIFLASALDAFILTVCDASEMHDVGAFLLSASAAQLLTRGPCAAYVFPAPRPPTSTRRWSGRLDHCDPRKAPANHWRPLPWARAPVTNPLDHEEGIENKKPYFVYHITFVCLWLFSVCFCLLLLYIITKVRPGGSTSVLVNE